MEHYHAAAPSGWDDPGNNEVPPPYVGSDSNTQDYHQGPNVSRGESFVSPAMFVWENTELRVSLCVNMCAFECVNECITGRVGVSEAYMAKRGIELWKWVDMNFSFAIMSDKWSGYQYFDIIS